jgi:thiamine pyrophosphokinase
MVKRAIIVAGGEVEVADFEIIDPETDWIVAADAGAKALLEAGKVPHLVVGDFDTAGAAFSEELMRRGIPLERLPAEKDETDTHYAVRKAVESGVNEVVILGALGGARVDHLLANVGLLEWLEKKGVHGVLHHSSNRIRLITGPGEIRLVRDRFFYVSLIPLTERVDGIVTKGLRYPLHGETLWRGWTRGISNEWSEEEAFVFIRSGKLLVVESRD